MKSGDVNSNSILEVIAWTTAEVKDAADKGMPILGICNGFQILTRLGLAPALDGQYLTQQAALTENDSGVFRDDWITLKADPESPCVFTRGIDVIRMPIRHGEGKFVADDAIIAEIEKRHLAAVRYVNADGTPAAAFPANPNGSVNAIAGICDPTGRVFGLMPHPEAFHHVTNHPAWTRGELDTPGTMLFVNAVRYLRGQ